MSNHGLTRKIPYLNFYFGGGSKLDTCVDQFLIENSCSTGVMLDLMRLVVASIFSFPSALNCKRWNPMTYEYNPEADIFTGKFSPHKCDFIKRLIIGASTNQTGQSASFTRKTDRLWHQL